MKRLFVGAIGAIAFGIAGCNATPSVGFSVGSFPPKSRRTQEASLTKAELIEEMIGVRKAVLSQCDKSKDIYRSSDTKDMCNLYSEAAPLYLEIVSNSDSKAEIMSEYRDFLELSQMMSDTFKLDIIEHANKN